VFHKAVLFDLDDTLYPESAYVLSGFSAVAQYLGEAYGVDIVDAYSRLACAFERGIRGNTFNLVLSDLGLSTHVGLVQHLVEVYRTHDPEIALHPDAARALSFLRSHVPLGLLTDGYAAVQRRKVKALGIEPFFDAIIYSDDLGRAHWKPSIVPFQHLLCRLGIEPNRAVYIGDNPSKDFIGARTLGITTIRIVRSGAEHCHTFPAPGFEPDYDLMTLDNLPAFLTS
jgi:putative hydrolase of the HAD superfamily